MDNLSGQNVGGYIVGDCIGQGGMSIVYRAAHADTGQIVALKFVARDRIPPVWLWRIAERFNRESEASLALDHPNILEIYEKGLFGDLPFLVCEYAELGSLKEHLSRNGGRLSWQDAFRLMRPIVSAVDFAHQRSFIHRDIKLANILLRADSSVVLADFGLVKDTEVVEGLDNTQLSLTASMGGVGTPAYMAPEQWGGNVDARADIYALGVTLFELVTGRGPFVSDTPSGLLAEKLRGNPRKPRSLVPELPVSAERLILKCMAVRPEQRYQSAHGLLLAIDDVVRTEAPRASKRYGPSPRSLTVGATTAMIAVVLVGVWTWSSVFREAIADQSAPTQMPQSTSQTPTLAATLTGRASLAPTQKPSLTPVPVRTRSTGIPQPSATATVSQTPTDVPQSISGRVTWADQGFQAEVNLMTMDKTVIAHELTDIDGNYEFLDTPTQPLLVQAVKDSVGRPLVNDPITMPWPRQPDSRAPNLGVVKTDLFPSSSGALGTGDGHTLYTISWPAYPGAASYNITTGGALAVRDNCNGTRFFTDHATINGNTCMIGVDWAGVGSQLPTIYIRAISSSGRPLAVGYFVVTQ